MKRLNTLKGLLLGLLALVLVIGTASAVKVKADPTPTPAPETVIATFKAVIGEDTYKVEKTVNKGEATVFAVATILAELKKGEGATAVAFPAADYYVEKIEGLTIGEDGNTSVTITEATTYTLTVHPKKLNLTFKVTGPKEKDGKPSKADDATGQVYTYIAKVDNKQDENAETKIKLSDILAGLSRKDGAKTVLYTDVFGTELTITEINGANVATEYTCTVDTVDATPEDATLTIVNSFEIGYNPLKDIIELTDIPASVKTIYYSEVKSDGKSKVDLQKFKKATVTEGKATIVLNDATKGLKIAENKDLYLYVTANTPAKEKTTYEPNYVLMGTPTKSITVNPRYAWADPGCEDVAIASIAVQSTEKSAKAVTYYCDETPAAEATVTFDSLIATLLYSTDGKTWYPVEGYYEDIDDDGEDELVNALTGAKLYTYCSKTKADKLQFRLISDVEITGKEDVETIGYRVSKAKATSIAIIKDLKSVKVDYVKGTVALKEKFDYYVSKDKITSAASIDLDKWTTLIPYNKDGSATGYSMLAMNYIPQIKYEKDGSTAKYFTSVKLKSMTIEQLCSEVWKTADTAYIYTRKSATAKAPASKIANLSAGGYAVAKPADAPTFVDTTDEKASKAGVLTSGGNYEYLIVNKTDLDGGNVDLVASKWTSLAKGKTITVDKSKSTVYVKDGDTSSKTSVTLSTDTYVLLRTAAVKDKSVASNYVITELSTATVGEKEVTSWKVKQ